jgi:hypothetical protein
MTSNIIFGLYKFASINPKITSKNIIDLIENHRMPIFTIWLKMAEKPEITMKY